ncbi:MAG: prepilin-type N-terminal cleavage/methylation domain-containing protein, partial [Candidatus Hydrogenedentota bacterium]
MMMPRSISRRSGFTLIELLVSLAIFTTIMAGVTIMFNSVVRVTKQGYLNQKAFETVRGALSIIEEDLTRSFGSRATGHKHTFYGTPFGFTFIGLVPSEDSDDFNLARITYV